MDISISTFMYAESAFPHEFGKINIMNPLLVFTPEYVPGQFSFVAIAGILGINFAQEYSLRYLFKGPNDDILIDSGTAKLIIPEDQNNIKLPPEMQGVVITLEFRNIVFKSNGIYKTEIIINNKNFPAYPIQVRGKN